MIDTFLLSVGWWNFFGSILMLGFLNESFGQAVLNKYTKIFAEEFKLTYWVKLWLFWAAGINIFFGLMNVMAVKWGYPEVKSFLVYTDIISYSMFFLLAIWGMLSKRLGSGVYSVFIIFAGWITWAVLSLMKS